MVEQSKTGSLIRMLLSCQPRLCFAFSAMLTSLLTYVMSWTALAWGLTDDILVELDLSTQTMCVEAS